MTETALPLPEPKNLRPFLLLWLGQFISLLGSGLTSFAIGVWIFQQTGQATPFALTVLMANLPQLLLLPLAGSLADRWNRKALMVLADTGNALTTLALFLLLLMGELQTWHIYLLVALGSAFSTFQEPAYTASVSLIVPKKDLTRANGLAQTAQAIQSIVTPLAAGGLFLAIGMRGIILIDFVTYFFAIGAMLLIHIPQPKLTETETQPRNQMWQDAVFGWQYLRARFGLFALVWYFAMVNFIVNFAVVLTGPLILSTHSAGELGIVQTLSGAGLLLGGLLISSWGGPKTGRVALVIGSIALSSLGTLVSGLGGSLLFPALGFFLLMLPLPIGSSLSQAVFQAKIAPEAQGRVFAMRALIARSMMPLAFLSSGFLADGVFEPFLRQGGLLAESFIGQTLGVGAGRGIGLMFVLAGAAGFLVSALIYLHPSVRNLEKEIPDAV